MEVVVQEGREIVNIVSTAYDAVYTVRHPFKSFFKKTFTFFGKKRVVNPAIETLNENFIEPIKEASSDVIETVEETVDNITEGVKNCARRFGFVLRERFARVTDKDRKINLIKSFIEENEQTNNIIVSINEGDIKLNFKDRLEIVKYAIKRDRKEISEALIQYEIRTIRSNIEKFEKRKNKIAELRKKNEELTKKHNMKNKWYGKVINFFNRGYFTKVKNELDDNENKINVKVEKNKNLIEENKVEYSLSYRHEDNSFNSDHINNFNNSVREERGNNSELNGVLSSLNNAISEINQLFNANPLRENRI